MTVIDKIVKESQILVRMGLTFSAKQKSNKTVFHAVFILNSDTIFSALIISTLTE